MSQVFRSLMNPLISIIIPTHNRKNSVLRTLESLKQQTFPFHRFEVVVVDDSSTDDTQNLLLLQYPFAFRLLFQEKQGATAARNYGASTSQAEILIFIDDDVTVSAGTVGALAETCIQHEKVIVMGKLFRRSSDHASVYSGIVLPATDYTTTRQDQGEIHFLDCNTELLACKRSDFFNLGMLQDPTEGNGWPNWDDVDFGYRAYQNGFSLLQCNKAIGEHWDYSITDWSSACQRWYRASRSAVWLLKKYQALQTKIPMLLDKTPLDWRKDPPQLIVRKLARSFVSSRLVIAGMVRLVSSLEKHNPSPYLLRRLYFLLQGAYMFHGYREGLRAYQQAETHA
jgi:glycosyltransferase involved in cell wall biosynthesis